jgi:myo-inositol-1(or 4)-monophosphatase
MNTMSSQTALHPMLNIAIKAARSAGAVINRASLDLDGLGVSVKAPRDFVTEVDQRAEEIIIDTLLTAFPSHGVLAEESGHREGQNDSEHLWIIDPLDGTTNFIHGLPMYAVSIALQVRGQVQQAVVYDPTRNDLFYASKGRGAFLNSKRLRVSRRTRMGEALIGTGFPFRRGDNLQRYLEMFAVVAERCAGLRRPGAASLDLCYVAAGWYDGFFETGLSPWDVAAGSLLITEAGGLVGNFTGDSEFLYQREVVAGNPKIYGQLVPLLAPFSQVHRQAETGAAPAASQGATAPKLTPESALAHAVGPAAGAGEPVDGSAAPVAPAASATTGLPGRAAVRVRRPKPLRPEPEA